MLTSPPRDARARRVARRRTLPRRSSTCARGERVARCRGCGEPLIVLVTIRGMTCVDLGGLATLDEASP